MDPADYNEEFQYGEEQEEETEEMMAIRSITEEGFSALKAEEFHRKRNKPRVKRETDHISCTNDCISTFSTNHSQQSQATKPDKNTEEMLAIQSIMGDDVEEQYVEETVIEHGEEVSQDDLEECIIAAAGSASSARPQSLSPVSDAESEPMAQEFEATPQGGLGQTVAEHYNMKKNVGTELRKNSRIVYMRNFNNWTKSMLIDEFLSRCKAAHPLGSPIRVLDMGAGKGGDMLKWMNGGVRHVVFADIARVSMEDCKTRYEELKRKEEAKAYRRNVFSAEFIPVDCSKTRLRSLYEDKALELDLVSCQFCIHYSFETVQQARCMLKNAAECLKPGGFFVGTVPDSNQIIARQRKHPGSVFGNDVYQIQCLFDTSAPIPLFGAKYDFNLEGVVNCPEFLVHFGLFERIAGEFGLKLILRENFKPFYERKVKEHSAMQLLRRMNALETYPPNEGLDTVGQENDYCHAEAYLSEHNDQKLGTLSKAEWEAITLYQVFAFEKVKGKVTPTLNLNSTSGERLAHDDSTSETLSKMSNASDDT